MITNDDLRRVSESIRPLKRTSAILWQNISLALGIKAVFFVLAPLGRATMWMAVFAHMGASLLLVPTVCDCSGRRLVIDSLG